MYRKIAIFKMNAFTEILNNTCRALLIFIAIMACPGATNAVKAIECTNPSDWKSRPEDQNTIFRNKNTISGAYIARVNRIIKFGPTEAHGDRGKYLLSSLYDVDITDVIRGIIENNTHTFLLIGTLSDEVLDTNFVIREAYVYDPKKANRHYLAFVVSRDIITLNSNKKTILGPDIILDDKLRMAIYKYTSNFLFVGDCSNWFVDHVYDGAEYDIIKYMNRYLSGERP